MKKLCHYTINLIGCFFVFFLLCTHSPTSTVGNGSDVGNAVAIGMLFNSNGSPAINATVKLIPIDHNPIQKHSNSLTIIDSTVTDSNGKYSIDSLQEGYYNILGKGYCSVMYHDSVFIQGETTTDTLYDTLKAPGSLRGYINLDNGLDYQTIYILVFGTFTFSPVESTGAFVLEDMAEGTYHVRIITTVNNYDPLDIDLTVISGLDSTLADTIKLPFTGIPIPTGLSLIYDTLKQIVTLTWNQADTNLVNGYNVYRKHMDSNYIQVNVETVKDSLFIDPLNGGPIYDAVYFYYITAVDANKNEGLKSVECNVSVQGNSKGWTPKNSIPSKMEPSSCTIGNILYCVGGIDVTGALQSLLKYDLTQNIWTGLAPIPEPRAGASSNAANGKIYYFGGEDFVWQVSNYEYDPLENLWIKKPNDCVIGKDMASCSINDTIYAIGGNRIEEGISESVNAYDPITDVWTTKSSLNIARTKLAVCSVNGKIYAIGGSDGKNVLNKVEEYDPETNKWSIKSPMPTSRMALACCSINGKIYAIGGSDGKNVLNKVEEYNPETDKWSIKSPMPTPRMNLTVSCLNEKLYGIGGFDGYSILGIVEEYDPSQDN